MRKIIVIFLCLAIRSLATTYASNGSQADVNDKIANYAVAGDIVTIPAGSFTWGASASHVTVNKAITLQGAGTALTTIVMSTSGVTGTDGVILITAAAVVKDFSVTGAINGIAVTPVSATNTSGFRVTNIIYTGPAATGYFAYSGAASGLYDHLTLTSNSGPTQMFQVRGPASWWSLPNTMGTVNAIYVEDCIFNGGGTASVTTGGAGRAVIRFCTFNAGFPIDAHMIETETTTDGVYHGSRQLEGYDNTWTGIQGDHFFSAFEVTGGAGMYFDNNVLWTDAYPFIKFYEYGATNGGGFDGLPYIPTPAHSPIPDQLGTGAYPQSAGQEPVYYFNNTRQDGTDMPWAAVGISATSITAYGSTFYTLAQTGSPSMFTDGVDYFEGVVGGTFPSTTKVGRGSKTAMLAAAPTGIGQAWWVTNEGNWNRKLIPNTSGNLRRWNGGNPTLIASWPVYYTPYTYPHPLQGPSVGVGLTGSVKLSGSASIK